MDVFAKRTTIKPRETGTDRARMIVTLATGDGKYYRVTYYIYAYAMRKPTHDEVEVFVHGYTRHPWRGDKVHVKDHWRQVPYMSPLFNAMVKLAKEEIVKAGHCLSGNKE